MGNSILRYVSVVKSSEIHITSVIIFHFGVHKGCPCARRVFMLRSHLCSCFFLPHLDTISFPNHTHTPIYVLPLTSLFNFFLCYKILHLPPACTFSAGFLSKCRYDSTHFNTFCFFGELFFFLDFKGEILKKKRFIRDLIDKRVTVWIKSAPSLAPAGIEMMK